MEAMKLSSSLDERKQIRAQCNEAMAVANRIKNADPWTPLVAPNSSSSRHERVGHWAARVAGTARPDPAYEYSTRSNTSHGDLFSTTGPIDGLATSGKSSASSLSAFLHVSDVSSTVPSFKQGARQGPTPLINLSEDASPFHVPSAITDASHKDSSNAQIDRDHHPKSVSNDGLKSAASPHSSSLHPQSKAPESQTAALTPSTAPHSQIHRLREPISSRKLPPRESIILLKASIVNGFKFPPWDKAPSADEFVSAEGAAPYTYIIQSSEGVSSKILTGTGTLGISVCLHTNSSSFSVGCVPKTLSRHPRSSPTAGLVLGQ
jgi:calpain-7